MASLAPTSRKATVDGAAGVSGGLLASSPGPPPVEKLKRVGEWVFGETLGQGSFGKVKLAHHAKTKELVRHARARTQTRRREEAGK